MDFKDGVSFWDYDGLAHIGQLYAPIEDDFDQALACLTQFAQQISQRYAQFRPQRVTRLADYNDVAKQPLARCLLVIDEAQSLFEGRDYQQKATVKRLELDGDVKDQFHLRMGLRHASAMGCRALMGRENEAMLHLPRFSLIYNSHQGDDKYNRTIALDDVTDFQGRLDVLKAQYPKSLTVTVETVAPVEKTETKTPSAKATNPYAAGDVDAEWD